MISLVLKTPLPRMLDDKTEPAQHWAESTEPLGPIHPLNQGCRRVSPYAYEVPSIPNSLKHEFIWRRIGLLAFLLSSTFLLFSTSATLHIFAFLKAMKIKARKFDLHYIHMDKLFNNS